MLPMQSLAVSMGIVTDDAAKSDKVALKGKGKFLEERYKKILKGSMKDTGGRIRNGILNGHADGSLRMIVTHSRTTTSTG